MSDSHSTLQHWLLPTVLPGVIHELNNPLGVLIMNVAMLKEDLMDLMESVPPEESEAVEETLQDMAEAIERINDIVKALGQISLEKNFSEQAGSDVKYLVQHALTIYHTRIKRMVTVTIEAPELKYLFANVEPGRAITAFVLAIEALIAAGGSREITVVLESSPDGTQILCSFLRLGSAKSPNYDKLYSVKEDELLGFTILPNGVQFRFKPHEQSSLT